MTHDLSSVSLDRGKPLPGQIYQVLRHRIVTGKIEPGAIIDEKLIAAQLHISRTPVREAVKKLSDENLVDVAAQSGTRAARIERHEVEQAFLIRRALEMESAAQAAMRMSPQHSEALLGIIDGQARAVELRKFSFALSRDDDFHRYISSMSDMPRVWRAIEISKAQIDRCRYMMLPRDGEAAATIEQHRAIVRALNSGDPEASRLAMKAHLDSAYANTVRAMDAGSIPVSGAPSLVGAIAGRRQAVPQPAVPDR
jgi:DNA-binding GntR family transcriptional regulator